MSIGKLAVSTPAAGSDITVYTVPVNSAGGKLKINILNTDPVVDAVVNIAYSAGGTPGASDYVEKGAIIPAAGGILERTDEELSPGENVIIHASTANTVVRVSGEIITGRK